MCYTICISSIIIITVFFCIQTFACITSYIFWIQSSLHSTFWIQKINDNLHANDNLLFECKVLMCWPYTTRNGNKNNVISNDSSNNTRAFVARIYCYAAFNVANVCFNFGDFMESIEWYQVVIRFITLQSSAIVNSDVDDDNCNVFLLNCMKYLNINLINLKKSSK